MKNKYSSPLFALGTFILCANFGSQDTNISGHEKPKINFYGSLTDTSGGHFEVENITISGLYKQIPFYAKPLHQKIDPSINITRLDLNEIEMIEIPHPDILLTFNGRHYIEVIITSADQKKTTQRYIIEKTKRVICDQTNGAGAIEKDLSFQAVDKIYIKGYKTLSPDTAPTHTTTPDHSTPAPAA
ncbi:hypothetical protein K9K77_00340 [Candidatus Babeliales bacterium]|nr:hypothetical protein [Candidatus Babeliales bacterium]